MQHSHKVPQPDIRDEIFASISHQQHIADIIAERDGIISGVVRLKAALQEAGVKLTFIVEDGCAVKTGALVATIAGSPKQIAVAEEFSIGLLAKASGIATAAYQATAAAGSELRIVSGAWKKVSPELKMMVREAIAAGGAVSRIVDQPFLYLDKNFVRMFGGIKEILEAVRKMDDKLTVIQLKGEFGDIVDEAILAVENGAGIIMIDTGRLEDVCQVHRALTEKALRRKVKIAFAKGIQLDSIASLKGKGIDVLDIGTSIIDAPLLDMKLDVRRGGL
jgi:nicotinate-nucleotide pyrophosphorylase (carboxylating)